MLFRSNVTISENQNTHVDFHHSYVSVGVTNHWVIQDKYTNNNGQRPVYGSGDVLLPKGARVQMTFTTDRDSVYTDSGNTPTVTYNGQNLTPVVGYDNTERQQFQVEFIVVDGATLDYRINADKYKQQNTSAPVFKVLEEAHTSSASGAKMMKSLRSPMLTAQGDEDNYVIDLTNTAGRADPPAGKKYVGDDWSQEVTLNSGNNWSEVLRGLDATDPEGNPYYYYVASVHEENLEAGTTCAIAVDGDKKLLIGKDKNTTANLSVTNRVSKGSIQITKTVMKNGAVDTSANATFYYGVYAEDYGQNSSQLPLKTGSITVGSGDNGVKSVRVDGLALGTYYVYELTGPQGTPIQDGAWQTFNGTVYRVTGSGTSATAAETPPNVDLVNSTETVNVEVEKIWLDNNNEKGKRPESLKVTLSNGHEVTLNSGNSWKASVTGLPKYNASGEPIQYTWTEETLSGGYVPIGSSTDTTIENGVTTETTILKNGPDVHYNPLTSFVGTKTWVDDGTTRPEKIEIILYNGTGEDKQEVARTTLEKPEVDSSEWQFKFDNLPIFDEAGNAIQYSVDEVLPDGYILSFDLSNNAAPGYERDTKNDRVFVNEPNAEMEISTGVNLGFIVMKHGNDFIIWTPRKATDQEIAEIKQLVAGEENAVGDEEFSQIQSREHTNVYGVPNDSIRKGNMTASIYMDGENVKVHFGNKNWSQLAWGQLAYTYTPGKGALINTQKKADVSFYKKWLNAAGAEDTWKRDIEVVVKRRDDDDFELKYTIESGAVVNENIIAAEGASETEILPSLQVSIEGEAGHPKYRFTVKDLDFADSDGTPYQYYIQEVRADDGWEIYLEPHYSNLNAPSGSAEADSATNGGTIINQEKGIILPNTGSVGTAPYHVLGVLMILLSGAALVISRRRRRAN